MRGAFEDNQIRRYGRRPEYDPLTLLTIRKYTLGTFI